MTPPQGQTKPIGWIIAAAAAAAAAGIFVLDFMIPRGIAVPMLYVLPILSTRYISGWWSTAFPTGGVVLLSWVGLVLSTGEVTPEIIGNRAMASFLLLVVAGLLLKEKHLAQQRAKDQMELRESEERYALVVAGAEAAIWDWNVPEKRVFFSPRWKALRGLADDEVSDHETEWNSRIHPDDRERVMAAVRAHFEGRTAVFSEEYRVRHKDGRWIWILDHGIAKRDSAGNVVRMAGSETDITARKQAEQALREKEERLGGILSSATDAVISVDERQHVVLFNKAAEAMFGCGAAEAIGQPLYRFLPERFRQVHRAQVEEFGRSGITDRPMGRSGMVYGLRANGQEFPAEASISQIESGGERLYTVIMRDITERKQSEEALRQAELRYRTIFEQVGTGVAQVNSRTGRFERVNRMYCEIVGLTDEEMLATTFMSITHPDDLAEDLDAMERLRSGEIPAFTTEKRYVRKDGSIVWVNLNVAPLWEPGQPPAHHIAAVQDITKRKEAEIAEAAAKEQLQAILTATDIGTWQWDLTRNVLVTDANLKRLFHLEAGEEAPLERYVERMASDDRERIEKAIESVIREGGLYDEQYRVVAPDGTERWIHARGKVERDEGGTARSFSGVVLDITERKQAEDQARRAAADLAEAQRIAKLGSWRFDVQTGRIVLSDQLCTIFDVEPSPLGQTYESFLALVHPDDRPGIVQANIEARLHGTPFDMEFRVVTQDGFVKTMRELGYASRDAADRVVGLFGTVQDITERKQVEIALRENEERLRLALESANMGTWDWDSETDSLLWNDRQFELFDIRPEDFHGTGAEALARIHDEDRSRVAGAVRRSVEEGVVFREEFRVVHADGSVHWLFGSGRPQEDEHGRGRHVVGVNLDITERRRAQEEMQNLNEVLEARVRKRTIALVGANERWDWVVRATNDGIWDWDLLHDTAYFSPRWKEMHGFLESDRTESTKEWLARIHPEDRPRVLASLNRCHAAKGSQFYEEYRVQKKDGIYFWVLDRGIAVFNDEGRAIRMIGAESDITWRKEAEMLLREREAQLRDLGARLLRAQEEERRRISRDLHDDVMQRMGALTLDLYSLVSSAASPDGELQSQLKSCGASAEQLTTDLQRMAHQLHPSILEFGGLAAAAREHVHEFAMRTGLSAELLTRNLPQDIPLDHATCLYRVLQEGLQNVQKHADANTVLVRLLGTDQGVGLCIHDDGHGFEEVNGTARRQGLGLTSMGERVGMLNGTFRIRTKPGDGTEIHAWVPLEEVKRET